MPVLRPESVTYDVRPLAASDLDAALGLSTIAGWNQQLSDWRMLFQLGAGCAFAAVAGSRIVGTALGLDYRGFAWVAMMLVHPDFRGCGIGGRLLEATLESLPSDCRVRLDATPLGRPLYQRFGFQDEATLTRHVAEHVPPTSINTPHVRAMTDADLSDVFEADESVFGGFRRPVLEWAFRATPQLSVVASRQDRPFGYCFGRRGRLFDQIGPVVAADGDTASAIVDTVFAIPRDRPLAIDVFDDRTACGGHLAAIGFTVQRPLFRMNLDRRKKTPRTDHTGTDTNALSEFAIAGPEFG